MPTDDIQTIADYIHGIYENAVEECDDLVAICVADSVDQLDQQDISTLVNVDYTDEDMRSLATQLDGGMIIRIICDGEEYLQ